MSKHASGPRRLEAMDLYEAGVERKRKAPAADYRFLNMVQSIPGKEEREKIEGGAC